MFKTCSYDLNMRSKKQKLWDFQLGPDKLKGRIYFYIPIFYFMQITSHTTQVCICVAAVIGVPQMCEAKDVNIKI